MMGSYWHGMSGWGMPFGGLFSLLLLILILVALYRALGGQGGKRHSDALSILEQRYARGEIQREEYLEKKRDLTAQ